MEWENMTIREHPLAWRWTDRRYALLPDEVLQQMHPLDASSAEVLDEQATAYEASTCETLQTNALCADEAMTWLLARQPEDMDVFVSWDPRTALQTRWSIFCRYWRDFCYPASDDIIVLPEESAWVLRYHPSERFMFGRRR